MSNILKQYLQTSMESFSGEVREPEIEDLLELSFESFDMATDALDNAFNLAISLEHLVNSYEAEYEHSEVSLEQFGEKVALVFQTAGIQMPLHELVPSMEEAKTADAGGKVGRIRSTVRRVIDWIVKTIREIGRRMQESGVWMMAQISKTKEAATSLGAKAKNQALKVKDRVKSDATQKDLRRLESLLSKATSEAKGVGKIVSKYAAKGETADDKILGRFTKAGEVLDEIIALKVTDAKDADIPSINLAGKLAGDIYKAMDALQVEEEGSRSPARDAINRFESEAKALANEDGNEREVELLQNSVKLLKSARKEYNSYALKYIRATKAALREIDKVIEG